MTEGKALYGRAQRAGSAFFLMLLSSSDQLDRQQLEPADFPAGAAQGSDILHLYCF